MSDIFILVGLPACGKTTYAKEHLGDLMIIDDPRKPDDITKGLTKSFAIASPMFCLENVRKTLDTYLDDNYKGWDVHWIWFKNEPDKCKRNVERRDDGRLVNHAIDILSKKYEPPNDAIGVYDGDEICDLQASDG